MTMGIIDRMHARTAEQLATSALSIKGAATEAKLPVDDVVLARAYIGFSNQLDRMTSRVTYMQARRNPKRLSRDPVYRDRTISVTQTQARHDEGFGVTLSDGSVWPIVAQYRNGVEVPRDQLRNTSWVEGQGVWLPWHRDPYCRERWACLPT
jgi:hypothetical protein